MSTHEELLAAKQSVRDAVRAARGAIDATTRERTSAMLAGRLAELPALLDARVVLAYGATPEEADPGTEVAALRERGVTVAYPRIAGPGALSLHIVAHHDDLIAGPFGLREPAADSTRIDPEDVDVVLVPGVAFDEDGYRLGYGGGYYDRLLPRLDRGCVRIGLAYDEQVVARVPREVHDMPVDVLVTPTRTIETGRRGP